MGTMEALKATDMTDRKTWCFYLEKSEIDQPFRAAGNREYWGVGAGRGATAKAPLILGGGVFGAMHGCIVAVDELFLS